MPMTLRAAVLGGRQLGARLPVMTDSRDRSGVASTLMMLTCLVLGLLAGGMLVIGVSFVSFWKSLSPSGFGLVRLPLRTSSAG